MITTPPSRLSGEVFRGMKENATRGAYQARPPLGYKVIETWLKPPVIVPEEAAIVRMIFDKYVNWENGVSFDIGHDILELSRTENVTTGKAF